MKEFEMVPGQEEYWALVSQSLKNRKKVKTTSYGGWTITSYVGSRPTTETGTNITHIEYSASAKTGDFERSQEPNLSDDPRTIRVDFDDTSVVTLSAKTMEELTNRLKEIFNGFHWEQEKERHV